MPALWCDGPSVVGEMLEEWGVVWRQVTFVFMGYTAPKKQYKAEDAKKNLKLHVVA